LTFKDANGGIARSILGREEPLAAGKIDLEITQASLTLAPTTKTGENLRNQEHAY